MNEQLKEKLMELLEEVVDPELNIDIVNLGLVYGIEIDEEQVATVTMTLTSMGCPMAPMIIENIKMAFKDVPEIKRTVVNIVWNPPWSKERMSRYAKIALGIRD